MASESEFANLWNSAVGFYNQHRWKEAIVAWRELLAVAEENESANIGLIISLTHRGRYSEAIEHWQGLKTKLVQYDQTAHSLAIAFVATGKITPAINCARRASAINPGLRFHYAGLHVPGMTDRHKQAVEEPITGSIASPPDNASEHGAKVRNPPS